MLAAALAVFLAIGGMIGYRDAGFAAYPRGDLPGAVEGLTRRAEAGDGFAAFLIGTLYQNQDHAAGMPRSERAAAWFLKSARLGHAEGALLLSHARNLDGSSAKICALDMAVLADGARAGMAKAHFRLGVNFEDGRCVGKDLVRAALHYGRAAALADYPRERLANVLAALDAEGRRRLEALTRERLVEISEAEFMRRFFDRADGSRRAGNGAEKK
jgi:TPR repeat protein